MKLGLLCMAYHYSTRRGRCSCLLLPCLGAMLGVFVFALWFGMNSDKDNVHPILNQLIPAGHCACQTSTTFNCSSCLTCSSAPQTQTTSSSSEHWTFQYGRDDRRTDLDKAQCDASFPGLFEDVGRGVTYWEKRGYITSKHLDKVELQDGMTRAIIHKGELYVVETRSAQEDHRRKTLAILSSMYRALQSVRDSQLTIEFIFSIEDKVEDIGGAGHPLWVLGRKATEESVWLMPDFGFWAWENKFNHIGPYGKVVDRIRKLEDKTPWSAKEDKLVWRGKLSFAPKMRRGLLAVARNKPWGDVKELVWNRKSNFISMEDHCKYKFIAHVEGRAFSSSLKYRQACRSIVVAHKLQYLQHHHYLLQAHGEHQNYVEVERDFSDLPTKMDALLADPAQAQRIAGNNVKTFRERYLTPAAEACYWRALWEGWNTVWTNVVGDDVTVEKGLIYESFLLLESRDMMRFAHQSLFGV